MNVLIEPLDPDSVPAAALIAKLDAYLLDLYPAESNHIDSPEELGRSHVHFLGALENGCLLGCGAVKLMDDGYAEVKRIFVDPAFRGKGLAQRILLALEDIARLAGYNTLRLETGIYQPEALRMFENNGYARTGRYGNYPDDPMSVFMMKDLSDLLPPAETELGRDTHRVAR